MRSALGCLSRGTHLLQLTRGRWCLRSRHSRIAQEVRACYADATRMGGCACYAGRYARATRTRVRVLRATRYAGVLVALRGREGRGA